MVRREPSVVRVQSFRVRADHSGQAVELLREVHANRFTLSLLFERDLKAPDNLARRKAHVVDMVLSYLTNGAPKGTWTPPMLSSAPPVV